MLLRDDRQIALNQVETLCIEAADNYRAAAEKTGDKNLSLTFTRLAEGHERLAVELAEQIRALDDLPQSPDPDREVVEQMLTGIRALVSGNAREALLADRVRGEHALEQATQEALTHTLPASATAVLQRILAHTEQARTHLAAAHLE